MGNKAIICPNCKRVVGKHWTKSNTNTRVLCRKCNKIVIYNYETHETDIKPRPERVSSSAMKF